jgi:hypothetical protein
MFFTEGDTRWIKRHTQKSLKELKLNNNWTKLKRSTMKPTKPVKKKPAKRKPLHGESNSLVAKLLNLKYRLNDAYTKDHKSYVMNLISDIRKHNLTKIAPEDAQLCNALWKRYE